MKYAYDCKCIILNYNISSTNKLDLSNEYVWNNEVNRLERKT
jgi:hypothetical protein